MKTPGVVVIFVALVAPGIALAQEHRGASAANSARVVRDVIRISVDARQDKTVLLVAIDDDRTPFVLKDTETLLARRPVSILVRDPNPLAVSFTVSLESAEDPSQTALMKLVEALLKVSGSLGGLPGNVPAAKQKPQAFIDLRESVRKTGNCEAETTAENLVEELRSLLFESPNSSKGIAEAIARWRGTLDEAVEKDGARRALIDPNNGVIAAVDALQKLIVQDAKDATELNGTVNQEVARLRKRAEELAKKKEELTACERLTLEVYADEQSDRPNLRIAEIERLAKQLLDLARALDVFAARRNWTTDQRDYILTPVYTSPSLMQQVSIRFATLSFSVNDQNGIEQKSVSQAEGKLIVRQFDRLNVEIGAGVISAKIDAPTYGTVTRDGQTFAAKVKDEELSWQPAVVANFVCRCFDSARLQPMFQIGALPVPDNPALLLGVGARLFGLPKGHFGFSAGLAWAWVKEIPADELLEPVSGTAEIEERKTFIEKRRLYLMFQYVF